MRHSLGSYFLGSLWLLLLVPVFAGGQSKANSGLPTLPAGWHWQANPTLSDNFSGTHLDTAKWQPIQPYWAGRPPSQFDPANVSVSHGALRLLSTTRLQNLKGIADQDKDIWIQSACVSSLKPIASYGYYEARMKASDLSMTSSFWLQGKYSEIDVVEELGRSTKMPENDAKMLSNTHYFHSGWAKDAATPCQAPMTTGAADAFHTYGVWWKDANTVVFYLDGRKVNQVKTGGPFDEPMYLFFDTEAFIWDGYPSIDSLRDPRKNAMTVQWVHAWTTAADTGTQ
jgi:beta-glucanase (GH16 family)